MGVCTGVSSDTLDAVQWCMRSRYNCLNSVRSCRGLKRMRSSQIRRPSGSAAAAAAAAAAATSHDSVRSGSSSAWLQSLVCSESVANTSPTEEEIPSDTAAGRRPAAVSAGGPLEAEPAACWPLPPARLWRHCASSSTAPMRTWKKTVSVRKSACPRPSASRWRQRAARSRRDSSAARSSASGAEDRGGRSTPKCLRKSSSEWHVRASPPSAARSKATRICRSSSCQ
mmetsp:Transcript_94982/g.283626  ORF Transcript_94982/g.283626 Transcript_94982/m.283626 type:complete len:227 (+) Transcript_94982:378-1058(+)